MHKILINITHIISIISNNPYKYSKQIQLYSTSKNKYTISQDEQGNKSIQTHPEKEFYTPNIPTPKEISDRFKDATSKPEAEGIRDQLLQQIESELATSAAKAAEVTTEIVTIIDSCPELSDKDKHEAIIHPLTALDHYSSGINTTPFSTNVIQEYEKKSRSFDTRTNDEFLADQQAEQPYDVSGGDE